LFIGMTYFDLGEKVKIPEPDKVRLTALYALIPSAVLADILTLLFIGQIGWPLRRPQLQKSVAGFFAYAALLPAGVLIGLQYYPSPAVLALFNEGRHNFLNRLADDQDQSAIIWGVVLLTAGVMYFLRYAAVAGRGRRAIRKLLAGEA
jgi:hypothetical protein